MFQKESVDEYKKILSAACGVDLTDCEAQASAEALLRLYQAVFKKDYNETKEGHQASADKQGLA